MTAPRVLVREAAAKARSKASEPTPDLGWLMLGGLGLVFVAVAGADILLAWYPPALSDPEWRFGTVTTTFNSFPLLAMGLAFLMGSGIGRGVRWLTRTMTVVMLVMLVLVLVCAVLYLPTISVGLSTVTDPVETLGLKRAIFKTSGQLVMYALVFAWIGWLGFRHTKATP